jgi:hypothetical protein
MLVTELQLSNAVKMFAIVDSFELKILEEKVVQLVALKGSEMSEKVEDLPVKLVWKVNGFFSQFKSWRMHELVWFREK